MVNTVAVVPAPFQTGFRLFGGQALDTALAFPLVATQNGIVAHAGGGRTSATQIQAVLNQISTCATGADSVVLPAAQVGQTIIIFNAGAAAAQVFATGSDTIDGVAGSTGVVLTNAKRCLYYAIDQGIWISAQLGVVSA